MASRSLSVAVVAVDASPASPLMPHILVLRAQNSIKKYTMIPNFRVGMGYDVHRLVADRALWLGGILIPHTHGLLGHSDADVLIHAICDALLGAANMRDIGTHFPDTDAAFAGIDSKVLLQRTVDLIAQRGWRVGNVDCTVCAERPKLNPHIGNMQQTLAPLMNVEVDGVSIKATTTERLGFTGREEGIAAYATALIFRENETFH